MRICLAVMTCAVLLAPPAALPRLQAQGAESRVQGLYFRNTEVSKVLSALARKARANIVLPEELNTKVTVTLNNVTVDEGVRTVAALAGLAYRRIDNTFIVAKAEQMPKVLEQFGFQENVPVVNGDPAAIAAALREAFPMLTVHPIGRTLTLIGAPEDIAKAREQLRNLDITSAASTVSKETVVLPLSNVKATDIVPVLNNAFGKDAAQAVGENRLALTLPQTEIQRATELVQSLDQVRVTNSRYVVYRVKYSSARSLANSLRQAFQNITVVNGPEPFLIPRRRIDLATGAVLGTTGGTGGGTTGGGIGGGTSGGFGGGGASGGIGTGGETSDQTGGAGGITGGVGAQQNINGLQSRTLIIGGTEELVTAALKMLNEIDIPTPQVALDVKVISANPSTVQNLGIQWSSSLSTSVFEGPNATRPEFNPTSPVRNNFSLGNWARLPLSFNTILNAFFQRTDVRILAKPTITALDNEEGIIFVGETRRIQISTIPTNVGIGTGSIILNQVVEIPVGIILQMTPRILDDEMIQLRVHPIVSSVTDINPTTGLFNTLNREAQTTIRIKSGETIVIGGLLQDEDTKTFSKVPILGDIPLIGQLFRNHSRTHTRQEVLVFVTPHLIKE
ncbi:MAG TPA: secretin and TonB N-terminal domain-containing protein [Chthonomonadaceae bacterium]|nr:secretin and TonB N-terminal domain-containing protein [Chthonomonadaceae bacterium]